MKAKCTECNQMTKIAMQERKHPRGIHETYFTCDVCHVHTTCFVTNAKVRKLLAEVEKTRGKRIKSALEVAEMKRSQAKIESTMDELKAKYGR